MACPYFTRRRPAGLGPCAGVKLLRQPLADEKSAHISVGEPAVEGEASDRPHRLSDAEKLYGHGIVFGIAGWNLFAINLARTPGKWWSEPVLAVWGAVLLVHAVWVFIRRCRVQRYVSTSACARSKGALSSEESC